MVGEWLLQPERVVQYPFTSFSYQQKSQTDPGIASPASAHSYGWIEVERKYIIQR